MLTRRTFLIAATTVPLTTAAIPAFAANPPVYAEGGTAINGYDPVAYFTQGKPVEGSADFTTTWNGATWRFSSAETLAQFVADPEAYAPQYGGYCAYAAARNYIATTSPNAWSIYNGKLYLNYNRVVRGLWERDKAGNIANADANWPGVLNT